jgi:hypothetical protein
MLGLIETEPGRTAPVFICDACQEPIRDAFMGLAIWFKRPKSGKPVQVQHVHKGTCDRLLVERNGGREAEDQTQELTTFLIHLLHNTGVPVKELYKHDEKHDISGFPGFA